MLDYAGFGPTKNQNIVSEDSLVTILKTVGFDKIDIIDGQVRKLNNKSKMSKII